MLKERRVSSVASELVMSMRERVHASERERRAVNALRTLGCPAKLVMIRERRTHKGEECFRAVVLCRLSNTQPS